MVYIWNTTRSGSWPPSSEWRAPATKHKLTQPQRVEDAPELIKIWGKINRHQSFLVGVEWIVSAPPPPLRMPRAPHVPRTAPPRADIGVSMNDSITSSTRRNFIVMLNRTTLYSAARGEHRAPSTERRAPSAEHGAASTERFTATQCQHTEQLR